MRKRFLWAIFPTITAISIGFLTYDALNPAKPVYGSAVTAYKAPVSVPETFDKQRHCLDNIHCKALSEALFHEARGESTEAQIMVAAVILNRRDALRWPNDVYNVVHQKRNGVCQFSYVCQLTRSEQQRRIAKEPKAWKRAIDIAYRAYYYEDVVETEADHYYNPKRVRRKPKFAYAYKRVAQVGSHVFYASN